MTDSVKTAYIFGRIHGTEDLNYEKFKKCQDEYEQLGFEVVNPHNIRENWSGAASEQELIKNELRHLMNCDVIVLLDDWLNAKPQMVELAVAQAIGIKIVHQDTGNELEYKLEITGKRDKVEN